ncbi:uncharacterized protein LOC135369754 isoform X2 [Ornithodoros turicata]|uniref:uncharacterized protein LOC135369754 isoform X2 n=1 Tax=Ornithodoros turicata TaxID=34597 RepID=UPI00313918D0
MPGGEKDEEGKESAGVEAVGGDDSGESQYFPANDAVSTVPDTLMPSTPELTTTSTTTSSEATTTSQQSSTTQSTISTTKNMTTTNPTTTTTTTTSATATTTTTTTTFRPITVTFVGDASYGTFTEPQFIRYAQSMLNLMNAFFASVNARIKTKVHKTFVMTKEQEKKYLPVISWLIEPTVHDDRVEVLPGLIDENVGVKEADLVFVLTQKLILGSKFVNRYGMLLNYSQMCERDKFALFTDDPGSYQATLRMTDLFLKVLTPPNTCSGDLHTACVYGQLRDAHDKILVSSKCHTSPETFVAPTFSGMVRMNLTKLCSSMYAVLLENQFQLTNQCTVVCNLEDVRVPFLGICPAVQESSHRCYDKDDQICFFHTCGMKYSDVKALARKYWNMGDSYYKDDEICAAP